MERSRHPAAPAGSAARADERPSRAPLVLAAAGTGAVLALALTVAAARATEVTWSSPIVPPDGWLWFYRLAVPLAFACYAAGVAVARVLPRVVRPALAVGALIQLLPLVGPLLLSLDAVTYWMFGRVQELHGGNPYVDRPIDFPEDPVIQRMGPEWRPPTSPYGPVFTAPTRLHAALVGDDYDLALLVYRVIAALAFVGVAWLAARAARNPTLAAVFVSWNPLFALHFAGGGHNDALIALFLVGGFLLAARGRPAAAGAAWALGAGIKWFPAVLLLPWLVASPRRQRLGIVVGFAAAVALGSLAATALYGVDWLRVAVSVRGSLSGTSSISSLHWLQQLGVPNRVGRALGMLAFLVGYVLVLRRARADRRPRLGLTAALIVVTTPWLMPWYAAWGVPLAAAEEDRTARLVWLVLSAYLLSDAVPR